MIISRKDRGLLAKWWFTIDRPLMFAVFLLMACGVLFSLAASPGVAERLKLPYFHFVERQLTFIVPAVVIFLAVSFLEHRVLRRVALFGFGLAVLGMIAAFFIGPEIKGARRWIDLGVANFQPSELAKPTFILIAAWLLAEGRRKVDMPGQILAWAAFGLFTSLLVIQPDFGQTALVGMVWAVMLLVYGISWWWIGVLGGMGIAGAVGAYFTSSHVASRVDRFLKPGSGDTYQVDMAQRAFENGGLYGAGPGGGVIKRSLPDSHTDFIFAVVGEEFGLIACLVLMALIAFVALRVLRAAMADGDSFVVLALTGLISMFSFQAIINMAVNVSLMPAKGMTLPFISYGGSSLLTMAFAMGAVLSLTRMRPQAGLSAMQLQAHAV